MSHRSNILFAFADDWGQHASAYTRIDGPGTVNDLLQTPQFDRVAREGVLYRSAFVSAPSCTPCRSALLSGQHFWRTGRGILWTRHLVVRSTLTRRPGGVLTSSPST